MSWAEDLEIHSCTVLLVVHYVYRYTYSCTRVHIHVMCTRTTVQYVSQLSALRSSQITNHSMTQSEGVQPGQGAKQEDTSIEACLKHADLLQTNPCYKYMDYLYTRVYNYRYNFTSYSYK